MEITAIQATTSASVGSLTDLGLDLSKALGDVWLGIVAFVMLTVPMLAIQLVLTVIFQPDEKHPFIDMIMQSPDLRFLGLITFAAIVVAPLAEEFLFRVILLGWLERVLVLSSPNAPPQPDLTSNGSNPSVVVMSQPSEPPELSTVYEAEIASEPHVADDADHATSIDGEIPYWWLPIVVTGVLFGLAHWGQGTAPVALVFLGCGLGYVYHRTHRVVPCIVVHFLVNLLAVLQLGLYIVQQTDT